MATIAHPTLMTALTASVLGTADAARALATLPVDPAITATPDGRATRAAVAMALNICLFDDLLKRVPSGAAYVADVTAAGGTVHFDHGALRTILMPGGAATGALPPGEQAFTRILLPLGYTLAGTYPLPRLKMTGRAYAQADHPATIPQFFLSELHVDQFDGDFTDAAGRVFGTSVDPLGDEANHLLAEFAAGRTVTIEAAAAALPQLVRAFDRQHERPMLADYETLLAQSAEAGWIATEGNAFNHATDRVPDVDALAAAQRALGRPMKDTVEVSASGRVRQTAFRADTVERRFGTTAGEMTRAVPGSFYEFITRDVDPDTGAIDLRFDSANATGIFAMTKAS
jgi:hypothetical protein